MPRKTVSSKTALIDAMDTYFWNERITLEKEYGAIIWADIGIDTRSDKPGAWQEGEVRETGQTVLITTKFNIMRPQ